MMTHDNIIRMAREAGWDLEWGGTTIEQVQNFAALVAAAEREACAKLCDETKAARLAEQIRARGGE